MNQCFLLSKRNLEFSRHEVLALAGNVKHELVGNLLIADVRKELSSRLAFTKAVYKFLFRCTSNRFLSKLKNFDWNKVYEKNFYVRLHHFNDIEPFEIAGIIGSKLNRPKIDVKNSSTQIDFFKFDNTIICALFVKTLNHGFSERVPQKRPAHHPTSMDPRLARALVNLTGAQKGTIFDPMCGSGGILIEAGLMCFRVIGFDNDPKVLEKARMNLNYYRIKCFVLELKDATTIKKKCDYIVTDLPYGRATKKQDVELLYNSFLKTLKKVLKKRAVIVFPHFFDYRKAVKKSKLKLIKEFDWYVHHTLTRKVVVLEN